MLLIAAHAHSTGASGLISLEPLDRSWLHSRIAQRFDAMLDQGFLDEVRALRARGDLNPELPSMRAAGYRQVWSHLAGECDATVMAARGIAATRQLAKRQLTWLRGMDDTVEVECLAPELNTRIAEQIRQFLQAQQRCR